MSSWLLPLLGASLVLGAMADVFLTVLYARGGVGLISPSLSSGLWQLFRRAAGLLRHEHRGWLLSLTGPTLLVAMVLTWAFLLAAGFALIAWPGLGTGIQASQGPTPTDFWAALYYSGFNLTTLGVGDLVPKTSFYRILAVLEAGIGFSVFTLTLTYFMSVYSALIRRNTLALLLDQMSGGSGDAAELLARLGAGGDFGPARPEVTTIATEVLSLLEAHHSYPVLHYFRRREPAFAMARVALVVLDAASLARSALDPKHHRSFVRSASIQALWGSGLQLLAGTQGFVPREGSRQNRRDRGSQAAGDEHRWRARFAAAVRRLQEEGTVASGSPEAGADEYVAHRRLWNQEIWGLARYMDHEWAEIAPHETRLASADAPGRTPQVEPAGTGGMDPEGSGRVAAGRSPTDTLNGE
ncbi:potassium channel family protein [Microvirga sp. GCM10011540]|uniref:potassium channel family protein n=1 Tax=Microvirga sp. GCM10011540 TaxID=3317338 RepID=UPI00360F309A